MPGNMLTEVCWQMFKSQLSKEKETKHPNLKCLPISLMYRFPHG